MLASNRTGAIAVLTAPYREINQSSVGANYNHFQHRLMESTIVLQSSSSSNSLTRQSQRKGMRGATIRLNLAWWPLIRPVIIGPTFIRTLRSHCRPRTQEFLGSSNLQLRDRRDRHSNLRRRPLPKILSPSQQQALSSKDTKEGHHRR